MNKLEETVILEEIEKIKTTIGFIYGKFITVNPFGNDASKIKEMSEDDIKDLANEGFKKSHQNKMLIESSINRIELVLESIKSKESNETKC